ncbi:hypothetical protein J437_LFUL015984 [Ladona fulva]|uniref:Uncharacterized protein n=1 Tax=Ladona fulva TaxID=123851 RepID=A0A8K0P849_LADFU|nr:hypothetical protein J437_LFUL015984 [Ladona fulva]
MAKKYGFRNPPGITYFRKGKYINYDGDIDDEEEVLDWLTNPENMELTDHIERVNYKMFQKIRANSDYVAVFFWNETVCQICHSRHRRRHAHKEGDGEHKDGAHKDGAHKDSAHTTHSEPEEVICPKPEGHQKGILIAQMFFILPQ